MCIINSTHNVRFSHLNQVCEIRLHIYFHPLPPVTVTWQSSLLWVIFLWESQDVGERWQNISDTKTNNSIEH